MAKRPRHTSLSSDAAGTLEHTSKYTTLEDRSIPPTHIDSRLHCDLHSQTIHFDTLAQYEAHYSRLHLNRCRECKKNFPSSHVLELHIAEQHDAFLATRRDRGEKTYACFVEGCDKVCFDWKKRRSHLVDKHGYPRNFDFFIIANGIDGRKSLLRPGVDAEGHRQNSGERPTDKEADPRLSALSGHMEETTDSEHEQEDVQARSQGQESIAELTSSMSALRMVPRKVQFGRGRAGLSAH